MSRGKFYVEDVELAKAIDRNTRELSEIRKILHRLLEHRPVAKSLTVSFQNSKGETIMPATLQIGQTAQAVATEWSGPGGTGTQLPLAGAIAWATSDVTIATVDPVSGLVTAVGPGSANIQGTDAANGLSGMDVVSDQPITAQSLTVLVTAIPLANAAAKKA